jgi:hypothetical protein
MQCNASYTRFIFGKFFICTIICYAFYMHSYVDKKFILVKSGCYTALACRRMVSNLIVMPAVRILVGQFCHALQFATQ